MHILLVHQVFNSPKQAGGTRHYELSRHLVKEGHQVTIIASTVSYRTAEVLPLARGRWMVREQLDGIEVRRMWTLAALNVSYFARVLSFLSFMFSSFVGALRVDDVDVVWGTSPPLFQVISAYVVARLRRVPFVFEVRDLWPDFAIEAGVLRNSLLIWVSRRLEHFLYHHANHLIVNSPGFMPHLRCYGVSEHKIDLVPNGVEVGMFNPTDQGQSIRQELKLDDKFLVLYAGAHGAANDLQTLLLAAEQLEDRSDIVFLLVGDGKVKPDLMRQAEERDLYNVHFIPAQPKSRMPEFLAAADAGLAILKDIPMFATTYPNKVFDYMAAGRPTVLAIDGVIREVVRAADGGVFVSPGDPDALAQAVRDLANDPERCVQMGRSARSYVVDHFERRVQAAKLETILAQVSRRETK